MIEERIGRITTNLRPKGVLPNQYGLPQNLFDRMTLEQIPGLSITVVNGGEIEWARGFGVKEYGQPASVTTETLFEAASITKTIFTVALMKLVSEGVLDIDEDVNSYLKSWRVPKNGNWQPIVTLRQILSHTAGLNIHGVAGYARGDTIPTLVQVLNGEPPSIQPPITVDGIPGLQNRYSTGGYAIAEQVVIDVVGCSVAELVHEIVLEPLQMVHSSMDEPLPSRLEKMMATGHTWGRQPIKGKFQAHTLGVSRLRTTPSDLARLGIEFQRALQDKPTRVISNASAMQMLNPPIGNEWGLGLRVAGRDDSIRFWMTGSSFGFVAMWVFYRDVGKGAIVMNNFDWGDLFLYEVTRAIAREYAWPDYSDTLRPQDKSPVEVSSEILNLYTGRYVTSDGKWFEVDAANGHLVLRPPQQHPLPLFAESATQFFTTAANFTVTFDKAAMGEIKGLVVRQSGSRIVARRT